MVAPHGRIRGGGHGTSAQYGQHCSKVPPTLHTSNEFVHYQAPLWALRHTQTTRIGTMLMAAPYPFGVEHSLGRFLVFITFPNKFGKTARSTTLAVGVEPEDGYWGNGNSVAKATGLGFQPVTVWRRCFYLLGQSPGPTLPLHHGR
ncbi:hypothetical protein SNOG_04110 [Parastagonospora nodorum SN15]|uniref:Uncharacterized protein n=1 Tax=Phaeosphaeria nodorum (strain SN15 / ATCC MYA-4574 / FGSC 10173) TaxID=321614 RepID=Q0UVV4_PHANO|nr:hypothetical protein SNOG_04110 [Parastagonospora nodorum SN15]EAT87870.1 hypothetical protein SNOG_04110 [Parastagonospora nodorum SN15]